MGFFKRLSLSSERGFKLSWLYKVSISEVLFILFTVILIPILIYMEVSEIFYIFYFMIIISLFLSKRDYRKKNDFKYPSLIKLASNCSMLLQLAFLVIIFLSNVLSNIMERFEDFVLFTLGLLVFLYGYIAILVIIIFINLIFFIVLKFNLPNEEKSNNERREVALSRLSQYMRLSDQVAYTLYGVITGLAIAILTLFIVNFISAMFPVNEGSEINTSMFPFIGANLYTLGNFLGLLSLTITLLSITVPRQTKIYNEAYGKYLRNDQE